MLLPIAYGFGSIQKTLKASGGRWGILGKHEVIATVRVDGVVPVFSNSDLDVVKEVATAVAIGGLHTFEFTVRSAGAISVASQFIDWARSQLPGMEVGAGTVLDAPTASRLVSDGAAFVFSPSFSAEVARVCHRSGVLYVPGCATVTEIQTAYEVGCEVVKLFPAGALGGPAFLAAVRAPCPWIQAIPTGGVEPTVESLKGWYEAGAPAVGMGGKLLPAPVIGMGNWAEITRMVETTIDNVAAARAA